MGSDSEVFERFRESDLPPEGQSEDVYLRYLKSLRDPSALWDRGKGWMSWLQGHALSRLTDSIGRKVCERGVYGRVLRQIGMKPTTAWYCRRIAATFTANEARTLGFSDMLYEIGARKKAATKSNAAHRGLLRKCEAFCKYLNRIKLDEKAAWATARECDLALELLTSIARLVQGGINAFEKRRASLRLRVVHSSGDESTAREAV